MESRPSLNEMQCPFTRQYNAAGWFGPGHGSGEKALIKNASLARGIGAHQPAPFRDKRRLDPGCKPAQRPPQLTWYLKLAEPGQKGGIQHYLIAHRWSTTPDGGQHPTSVRVGHVSGRHPDDQIGRFLKRAPQCVGCVARKVRTDTEIEPRNKARQ